MYMDNLRPVWAEINLDHLVENLQNVKAHVKHGVKVMAVVKADAYGHGAEEVARLFIENGVDYLAVATLSEAIQLRKAGLESQILILGYTPKSQYSFLLQHHIAQTIYRLEDGIYLDHIAKEANVKAKVHLKVDSGMRRLGFLPENNGLNEIKELLSLNNLFIEGIYTHFARADEKDKGSAKKQYEIFNDIIVKLEKEGLCPPLKHAANSATIIDLPEYHLNMVRAGIMLYGLYPSPNVKRRTIPLLPAMTLKARISHIKNVGKGEGISYGHIFKTKRQSIIGTLPIGYADGYSRKLSNRSAVFVNGKLAPVIGRICMDQCMIDLTDCPKSNIGDVVTLFGGVNDSGVHIDDIATLLETINYEIVCMVSRRVPRVYLRHNIVHHIKNYI